MRARLVNSDGSFVAEVEAPDGTNYIRYGERFFVHSLSDHLARFWAADVYSAPTEGALVVEP